MSTMGGFLEKRKSLVVSFICIVIILMIFFSPTIPFKTSDAMGSLLTAESIINHGTIKLDAYKGKMNFKAWHFKEKNGHMYYIFPIGNSLFALPIVGLTKLVKMRMTKFEDEIKLQRTMSAITVILSFILILLVSTSYLNFPTSLLLSSIFLFGSSLMSTMGVAFWSHNTAIVFILLSLLHIVFYDTGKIDHLNPYLLGFLLFASYLCRPTATIFIVFVFIYVWISCRSVFLKLVIISLLLFSIFIGFSLLEYNQILPDYYLPNRIGEIDFFANLYGLLLSPARGLLVYSPFLIAFPFVTFFILFGRLPKSTKSLVLLISCWFIIHLLVIGNFRHWWGGGGFGPRLLTDVIPALILITVLLWSEAQKTLALTSRRIILITCIILAIPSVFLNSYAGLFNKTIPLWNENAFYDRFPEFLNSWRYPAFLASPNLLVKRDKEIKAKYPPIMLIEDACYNKDGQPTILPYEAVDKYGTNVWRELEGIYTETAFRLDLSEIGEATRLQLQLNIKKNSNKRIRVILNGKNIGNLPRGKHNHIIHFYPVRRKLLKEVNILRLMPPPPKRKDAKRPVINVNVKSYRFVTVS